MHEWEHFCDVNVCEWVHDRVEEIVNKDHSYDSTGRLLILCFGVVCTRACPTRKNGGHADESDKVLRPAIEQLCDEG